MNKHWWRFGNASSLINNLSLMELQQHLSLTLWPPVSFQDFSRSTGLGNILTADEIFGNWTRRELCCLQGWGRKVRRNPATCSVCGREGQKDNNEKTSFVFKAWCLSRFYCFVCFHLVELNKYLLSEWVSVRSDPVHRSQRNRISWKS